MAKFAIGITERGDAGLDLSWVQKLALVNGVILITKNLTQKFVDALLAAYAAGNKIILHCGCTGWGGTPVEPNVPGYQTQLDRLKAIVDAGFPKNQIVLRIDPIFPTVNGLRRVNEVLDYAYQLGLIPDVRVRISILDEYKHVKQRFIDAGFRPMYGDEFYAPPAMMDYAVKELTHMAYTYGVLFETCAETRLVGPVFATQGCISRMDADAMGLRLPDTLGVNPQNRNGCLCLSCKTELLSCPKRCAHRCLYCYWQQDA